MRFRFVTGNAEISALIRLNGPPCRPFTPSHVEMVVEGWEPLLDSNGYLGAHADGGVMLRPIGYDAAVVIDVPGYGKSELFVEVPMQDEVAARQYAVSRIGSPYDFAAIVDFALPFIHADQPKHLICSAFATMTARAGGGLPFPIPSLAHAVSPAMLLNIFGGFINVLK
jgi:hypothetical protein